MVKIVKKITGILLLIVVLQPSGLFAEPENGGKPLTSSSWLYNNNVKYGVLGLIGAATIALVSYRTWNWWWRDVYQLEDAIDKVDVAAVKRLVNTGAVGPDTIVRDDYTALKSAYYRYLTLDNKDVSSKTACVDIITFLAGKKGEQSKDVLSVLLDDAVRKGDLNRVKDLVKNEKVTINLCTDALKTALDCYHAAKKKNQSCDLYLEIIKFFIAMQKDGEDVGTEVLVQKYWDLESVELLVTFRPGLVNAKNQWGETVLLGIANRDPVLNGTAVVNFLIEHGADVNLLNREGKTALLLALMNNDESGILQKLETAGILIAHGADVNVVYKKQRDWLDFSGRSNNMTAIFSAVELANQFRNDLEIYPKCCELIKLLVQHGAKPQDADSYLSDGKNRKKLFWEILKLRFYHFSPFVKDYLMLADDFCRTLKKTNAEGYLSFNAFITQYLEDVTDTKKAAANLEDIRALVASRGTENMASQLFHWMMRKDLLEKHKIKTDIKWFYLDLGQRAGSITAKVSWFERCFDFFGSGKTEFENGVSAAINKLDKKQQSIIFQKTGVGNKKKVEMIRPQLCNMLLIPKNLPKISIAKLGIEPEKNPANKRFRDYYIKW